jgi:hypothetical protein
VNEYPALKRREEDIIIQRQNRGERNIKMRYMMRTIVATLFVASLVFMPVLGGAVLDQLKDLLSEDQTNHEMTARIRAFDPEDFTQGFDVYAAEVLEAPTALLFDKKDGYHIPSRFWGEPLKREEIVYAIKRLERQYQDYDLPFEPRALNVINSKSEELGYVYTSVITIQVDRKDDGRVTVYPPSVQQKGGSGGGGGGR